MAYYRKPRNAKEAAKMNKLSEVPPKAMTDDMDFVYVVWRGTERDGSQARSEKCEATGTIYTCVKDSVAVKVFDLQDMEHFSRIKGFELVIAKGQISKRGYNFIHDIYDEGLRFAKNHIAKKNRANKPETAKEKKARLKAEKEEAERLAALEEDEEPEE